VPKDTGPKNQQAGAVAGWIKDQAVRKSPTAVLIDQYRQPRPSKIQGSRCSTQFDVDLSVINVAKLEHTINGRTAPNGSRLNTFLELVGRSGALSLPGLRRETPLMHCNAKRLITWCLNSVSFASGDQTAPGRDDTLLFCGLLILLNELSHQGTRRLGHPRASISSISRMREEPEIAYAVHV